MKPLIGYGSDVSASRPARLVGDKTSTWTYSRQTTEVDIRRPAEMAPDINAITPGTPFESVWNSRPATIEHVDDLAIELQKIYDSEINVRIGWFWDGGIDLRLGDDVNGYLAEDTVRSMNEIVPWLQEAIAHFYPNSEYADSLRSEIKERAAHRLFRPPIVGASVTCPHCGAPHAAPPGMDELIMFFCARCGSAVEVKPPKVQ